MPIAAGPAVLESRRHRGYVLAVSLAVAAVIAAASATRAYLGFGVESDLLLQFLPEAERLLRGQPLELPYHPPGYAVLLAIAGAVTGDWMIAGIALSAAAAAVALALAYHWMRLLCGPTAGMGAALAMLGSTAVVAHAGFASSDLVFLALLLGVACCAAAASRQPTARLWFWTGVLIGLTILVRTNGVTLLAAAALPWLQRDRRLAHSAAVLSGAMTVLAAWAVVAWATGSEFAPGQTYLSIAWYYYRRDLLFDDAAAVLGERYQSLWDVISADPRRIAVLYVGDLYRVLHQVFAADFVLNSPLNLLVLPGMLYLAVAFRKTFLPHVGVLIVPQLLLLNIVVPDQRYYLLLAPVFGAGAAGALALLLLAVQEKWQRAAILAVFVGCWLIAAGSAARGANRLWRANEAELTQAVAALAAEATPESLVVARKPHFGYYTGLERAWPGPEVHDVAQLHAYLATTRRDALVYLGSEELKVRPGLRPLAEGDSLPNWLVRVAGGTEPTLWTVLWYDASRDQRANVRTVRQRE